MALRIAFTHPLQAPGLTTLLFPAVSIDCLPTHTFWDGGIEEMRPLILLKLGGGIFKAFRALSQLL